MNHTLLLTRHASVTAAAHIPLCILTACRLKVLKRRGKGRKWITDDLTGFSLKNLRRQLLKASVGVI